jgi:hypothetical protein
LISEEVEKSKIVAMRRLSVLLAEHEGQLGRFLTEDTRGKHVPRYVERLASQLLAEREFLLKECEGLRVRIEHIKAIVAMQQNHSTVSGVKESVDVASVCPGGQAHHHSCGGRRRARHHLGARRRRRDRA